MKRLLLLQILVIALLSLSSCKLPESDTESETTQNPQTESSPEEQPDEEEKEQEETAEEPQSESSTVVGLKQATNPEEFVQERGETPGERRNDPFSLFPVPPQQSQAEIETLEAQREAAEEGEAATGEDGESPESLPSLPSEGSPQAPPQPEIARAVQVQGAIRIGNSAVAILKAPNDPNSRYVRPGNFIAGGQVLLKRINMEDRPTPTVVLEELGVDQEVIKAVAVAQPEETEETEETEQSVLPPPPPPAI
ncbi:hypothetical protein [Dactylococcopsis salina]|uniref:Tfp pilus assembly protein PilP n=1 Tax=Dactylococcopsis salina (strain PCC 8305) TaxID=13035 RepID=K9YRY5_DACS8|nr:hypothetical protein [Dactylococcopsis salina]AFZ49659.1 hypothetical protein Dacsa_0929 [Dactylococcopsis salina PCC 8305]